MTAAIRIWQFSDTHLFADPAGELYDCRTGQSLQDVLDHARGSIRPNDIAVVSGDLVHDESRQGYRCFISMFETLGIPVFCLPGNHDDPALMREMMGVGRVRFAPVHMADGWQCWFLDSTVRGKVGGYLDDECLSSLRRGLQATRDHHTLIFLHHPPLATGMAWLDAGQILENPQHLLDLADEYPQIRAIAWGHAHQEVDTVHNGIRMLGCPSTMVQFRPDREQFDLDSLPPGYRWLDCQADGRIETGVIRI